MDISHLFKPRKQKNNGYTLIEVICCMVIISIIGSIAIPAYSAIVTKQQMKTSMDSFHHSVLLARYESAISYEYVAICPSDDGISCASDGYDFSNGWISFKNIDRDYPVERDANEKLIESILLQNKDFSLVSNRKTFTFRPTNKRNTNGTLMLCPNQESRPNYSYKAVIVSYTGRPRLDKKPKNNHIKICIK